AEVPVEDRRPRLSIFLIAIAIVLAIAIVIIWRTRRTTFAITYNHRAAVVAVPFVNSTHTADAAWLGNALPQMLTDEISAGDALRVIPSEASSRMMTDLRVVESDRFAANTTEKMRNYCGTDLVLSGSFVDLPNGIGRTVRFTAHIQDARSGDTIASASEIGQRDDLFALVHDAGRQLRAELGVAPQTPQQTRTARAAAPANLAAVRFYAQGVAKVHAFELTDGRDLLQRAIDADPQYALAHGALSDAYTKLGYEKKAIDEAKRALDSAQNLSRTQQLEIEA